MFTIRTSKANKELVSDLTKRLNLGPENVIARLAFAYSLSGDRKMELKKIRDSGGKEYAFKVLFGENADVYIGVICTSYNLHKTDKDIPRYVKMHVDDGLDMIYREVNQKGSITGNEFLINAIEKGIKDLE